jgi:GNAT superfamily N-acetyltransferase
LLLWAPSSNAWQGRDVSDPRDAIWRVARAEDDDTIVRLCLALNAEDPGEPVAAEQVRRTLDVLRAEPVRGRALVAEVEGEIVGYALLISFWSNEYGGEICAIDELYIVPAHRSRGIGTGLFQRLVDDRKLWPTRPVALELETTQGNDRARKLYETLGFRAKNTTLRRRLLSRAE